MSRFITLKFAGTCSDCKASLPVGAKARWYGKGRIYGLTCHDRQGNPLDASNDSEDAGSHKRRYGRCEDAPCCGCCGGTESYTESYNDFN